MLDTGFAYPTYYSKLFLDIREAMTAAVHSARAATRGVWAKDKTMTAYVGHRDHPVRCIVITEVGDQSRSEATYPRPFMLTS